eukprot:Skav209340  [mRNA]  locus=scaffold241:317245:317460:+ [translate_table: standard]
MAALRSATATARLSRVELLGRKRREEAPPGSTTGGSGDAMGPPWDGHGSPGALGRGDGHGQAAGWANHQVL